MNMEDRKQASLKAAQSVFCWSCIIWYLKFRTFETRHLGARILHQHITMSQHSDCYGLHLCLPLWVGCFFSPPFQEPVAASSPLHNEPLEPKNHLDLIGMENGLPSTSMTLGNPAVHFPRCRVCSFQKTLDWLVVSTPLQKYQSKWVHLPQIKVKIKKYLKPPPSWTNWPPATIGPNPNRFCQTPCLQGRPPPSHWTQLPFSWATNSAAPNLPWTPMGKALGKYRIEIHQEEMKFSEPPNNKNTGSLAK